MSDMFNCQFPPKDTLLHNTLRVTESGATVQVKVLLILPGTEVFSDEITAPLPFATISKSTGSLLADWISTIMVVESTLPIERNIADGISAGIPRCLTSEAQYGEGAN